MIDKFFFVILVLNATELFSFLAPQFNVSIKDISLTLLIANLIYLLSKVKYSIEIFRAGGMWNWLIVLLLWPLLTISYAPSLELRNIGLQIYTFALFLATVVYISLNGLPRIHRVISFSLLITIIGLILSLTMPEYFESVAALANAKIEGEQRAFGFFLQPNHLAIATILLFIGWVSERQSTNFTTDVPVLIIFLLLILLTGSRTGILIALMVVAYISFIEHSQLRASGSTVLRSIVLLVCLVITIKWFSDFLSDIYYTNALGKDLIHRIEMLLNFKLSAEGGILGAGSFQLRVAAQKIYWSLFFEKPFIGHGLGSETYYLEIGRLFLTSHSDLIRHFMEYGVFYPVAFLLLISRLYTKRVGNDRSNAHGKRTVLFIMITILLYSLSSLVGTRAFPIILGMYFAMAHFPDTPDSTPSLNRKITF